MRISKRVYFVFILINVEKISLMLLTGIREVSFAF